MADPLETASLRLPYIAAAQAQKHVTHNAALKRLDGIVQLAVEATGATVPPGLAREGDRYLLGTTPSGAWAGQGGNLAVYADGAWWFAVPATGWLAFDRGTDQLLVLKSSGWIFRLGARGIAQTKSRRRGDAAGSPVWDRLGERLRTPDQ